MKWITESADYVFERLFVVSGAVLCMQVPEFVLQFKQRLGGHVDELMYQLIQLTEIAEKSGKTLSQYIEKFRISGDADFMRQAEFMQQLVERYDRLSDLLRSLEGAGLFSKVWGILSSGESFIIEQTWQHFSPGIPVTLEGLLLGLMGIFTGSLMFMLIKWPVQRLSSRKRIAPPEAA